MRAVVVHGAGDLRVQDVADPAPGADEVLVALEWGGICGSDLAYWRHGGSGTAVLREPMILGHEVSGRVAQIGPRAQGELRRRGIEPGTPVTLHPATLAGDHRVAPDLAARTNLWPEVRYFGSAAFLPHEQGGFSTHRVVRPDQLRVVPEGVSLREAAVAEPFGAALHAVGLAGDLTGRTVLVNGCGPIGALVVAGAVHAGAAAVVAADLSPHALRIAERLGAGELVDLSAGGSLPAEVEVAFEASGAPAALGGVIAAVRRGGTLVQVGNLPGQPAPIALGGVVTRELVYRGAYRFVDEISDALALMADGVDVAPLMTHEVALEEAPRGFELAADRSSGASKVMIRLS